MDGRKEGRKDFKIAILLKTVRKGRERKGRGRKGKGIGEGEVKGR